jgi:uncharacterized SAM-binding protein YcdF (DUF218 family)
MRKLALTFIFVLAFATVLYLSRHIFFGKISTWVAAEDTPRAADAIVVISGGGLERPEKGIAIYKEGFAPLLVFSGAAREGEISNAEAMGALAQKQGVESAQIILEEDSRDTFENARNVAKIIKERNLQSIILVSSSYHQRRALISFRRALGKNISVISVPASPSWYRKDSWWDDARSREILRSELTKIGLLYLTRTNNAPDDK